VTAEPGKQLSRRRPRTGDRVLTVRDPWAHLIITGEKFIENRTWSTPHRGRLWIHAGSTYDYDDFDCCRAHGIEVPDPDELPGGIIGSVELIDCRVLDDLPSQRHGQHWSAEGPICWILQDPVRLAKPIDCRGRLGVWRYGG
jgi:hypothetical protein